MTKSATITITPIDAESAQLDWNIKEGETTLAEYGQRSVPDKHGFSSIEPHVAEIVEHLLSSYVTAITINDKRPTEQ